jgi:hypothetical protein
MTIQRHNLFHMYFIVQGLSCSHYHW